MGTEDNPQTCDECDGENFNHTNDSILQRQYPFVKQGLLKMCQDCGAKYVQCPQCKALLTRVHLSIDVWGVRDACPLCEFKDPELSKWIEHGGGGYLGQ